MRRVLPMLLAVLVLCASGADAAPRRAFDERAASAFLRAAGSRSACASGSRSVAAPRFVAARASPPGADQPGARRTAQRRRRRPWDAVPGGWSSSVRTTTPRTSPASSGRTTARRGRRSCCSSRGGSGQGTPADDRLHPLRRRGVTGGIRRLPPRRAARQQGCGARLPGRPSR